MLHFLGYSSSTQQITDKPRQEMKARTGHTLTLQHAISTE